MTHPDKLHLAAVELARQQHDKILILEAEVSRLTACLKKANDQAEHFERGWYLRGDALEAVKAKLRIDDEHELYDTVCSALLVNTEAQRAAKGGPTGAQS